MGVWGATIRGQPMHGSFAERRDEREADGGGERSAERARRRRCGGKQWRMRSTEVPHLRLVACGQMWNMAHTTTRDTSQGSERLTVAVRRAPLLWLCRLGPLLRGVRPPISTIGAAFALQKRLLFHLLYYLFLCPRLCPCAADPPTRNDAGGPSETTLDGMASVMTPACLPVCLHRSPPRSPAPRLAHTRGKPAAAGASTETMASSAL